jgi:hypothetical protein
MRKLKSLRAGAFRLATARRPYTGRRPKFVWVPIPPWGQRSIAVRPKRDPMPHALGSM